MRTGKRSKLHILLFAILVLSMACFSAAEGEEPLTLTVEADPDCLLSEAGDMTFFRFTVKNDLDERYTMEDMSLQGDLLAAPKLIAQSISIEANDVLEFTLNNVRIEEFAFDMDLSFTLTWWAVTYAPEDVDQLEPIYSEHSIEAPIRIERFIEPLMTLRVSPDVQMAREGDLVTVTYTLLNDTKFDMTNITLQDAGVPQPVIPLERTVLNAQEQMEATATFEMGSAALELYPTVQYTVRGEESKVTVDQPVRVDYVEVDLKMEVEKYPATVEGTLFRITLINDGSHTMTNLRLVDEIGTVIVDGITLKAGKKRTVSCTVPSAVASGTVRYISFELSGYDCMGDLVTKRSPGYEVLPFVESDQVRLKLSVAMSSAERSDDGVNKLKMLFEIRNDSLVPISSAVVNERDYFKSVVNEYATLSTGTTTFEKEFIVPDGTRSLTFVLTAMDPAQTEYVSEPVTLDLSPLAAPKPTNAPAAIKPGKTVDISGTIYDTERYTRLFRMAALIVLALTLMFTLLSIIFHVAETNIRRLLPKEPVMRPFGPRKASIGPIPAQTNGDPIHDMFGYQQPAKLRYMDRTDRMPVIEPGEAPVEPRMPLQPTGSVPTRAFPSVSRSTGVVRRTGEITAVPVHRDRKRPVMITSNDTIAFAPVHESLPEVAPPAKQPESQAPATETKPSLHPRVIEPKPAARIVPRQKLEIVHVSQP